MAFHAQLFPAPRRWLDRGRWLDLVRILGRGSHLLDAPDQFPMSTGLSGIFLLVFLYWQVVPVLMAASGASLDLRKLQAYPIPVRQLFGLEVMLRVTVAIEVVLILTGAGIGIMRNPALHPWNVLGLVPFAAFNLVLGVGSRDTIARILARRRIREAAFFLLILCAALPHG